MERKRSRSPKKPDFKPSGILGKYENRRNGELMLYSEPLDGKKPNYHWRLFQFQNDQSSHFDLHLKSYFTIGKEILSDIQLNDSSISKQHAVIQFKQRKKEILPFLIDLNSKNGCFLNGQSVDSSRFYELKNKDLILFGSLKDEFVLIKGDRLSF